MSDDKGKQLDERFKTQFFRRLLRKSLDLQFNSRPVR